MSTSVVGTWTFTADWGCDGSITGSFNVTFNGDGTWTSTNNSGRWLQVEGLVIRTFNNLPDLTYSANVSGSWMAGIQGYTTSGGSSGCFGAVRESVATISTKAAPEGYDPELNR